MELSELLDRPALEQAERLRAREVSSAELVDACLTRISQLNPQLQAFVTVTGSAARRAARRVDQRRAAAGARPIFEGVPTGIKDCDPVRGTFTRVGSRAYRYVWAPFDSPPAGLLRRAGFVFLGKLATSEFTLMPVVEPDIHPPTRNPWAPERSPGGSSGGSAAAVAAGLLPVAHASDGAGSIRIPAALCHLFGFKPSRALLPNFYGRMEPLGLSAVGAVAHTVTDSAAFVDALRGQATWPPAPDSLLARCAPLSDQPLLVRVCTESPLIEVEAEIAAGVERLADTLADMGHRIERGGPLQIGLEEFMPVFQRLATKPPVLREASLQPVTRWLRQGGRRVTDAAAQQLKEDIERRILAWFGDADLWVLPTVGRFAPIVNEWSGMAAPEAFAQAATLGAFTAAFNLTGQPAASVPMGIGAGGLPFGVQVVGRPGADLLVLRVCRALEQALPWATRRPPPAALRIALA